MGDDIFHYTVASGECNKTYTDEAQEQEFCYLSCIFKKYNLLNTNGDINFEAVKSFILNVNESVIASPLVLDLTKNQLLSLHLKNLKICQSNSRRAKNKFINSFK